MSVDEKDVMDKVSRAKKVAKRRTRRGGKLRKAGQHWYELEAYFDEKRKEVIGVNESGFMLGVLEDFVIVEVPEDKPVEEVNVLGMRLADMGIKALIVKAGIRFLRLREITGEQEKKLNEIQASRERFEQGQKELAEIEERRSRENDEETANTESESKETSSSNS